MIPARFADSSVVADVRLQLGITQPYAASSVSHVPEGRAATAAQMLRSSVTPAMIVGRCGRIKRATRLACKVSHASEAVTDSRALSRGRAAMWMDFGLAIDVSALPIVRVPPHAPRAPAPGTAPSSETGTACKRTRNPDG